MKDSEKLDLILSGMQEMKKDISELKKDVSVLKAEMSEVKKDISELKEDVSELKKDVSVLKAEMAVVKTDISVQKRNVSKLEESTHSIVLHLENHTDNDVKVLAEHCMYLVEKMNKAIPAVEKHLPYEVKVDYLTIEVEKIKQDIVDINNRIA